MSLETYANQYTTTLAGNGGSIGSGTTTIHISSGTGAPVGQSRFLIGNELIVGSVSGTVLTATTRGAEGTTAASHIDGTVVQCVLTAASLLLADPSHEAQAGQLINAISTGDTVRRSTHFNEGAPPAGWVQTNASSAGGPGNVGNSVFGMIAGADNVCFMAPYTPSGNFRLETRIKVNGINTVGGGSNGGICVSDSINITGGSPNTVLNLWTPNSPDQSLYTQDGGTSFTRRVGSTSAFYAAGSWIYIALYRTGSNFFMDTSLDRVEWLNQGGGYSKSLTVAYMGFYFSARSVACVDFIDVVS